MIHPYLKPLIGKYEAGRDPERARQMKKYMKDQFEFYGIGTPERRAMTSAHIKEHGLPDWQDIEKIARDLWEMDERECQFTLLDLMKRIKAVFDPNGILNPGKIFYGSPPTAA